MYKECKYKVCQYKECQYKECQYKECQYKLCKYKVCKYKEYNWSSLYVKDIYQKDLITLKYKIYQNSLGLFMHISTGKRTKMSHPHLIRSMTNLKATFVYSSFMTVLIKNRILDSITTIYSLSRMKRMLQ